MPAPVRGAGRAGEPRLHHVDAPVAQVLHQQRVLYHRVLVGGVAVHVRPVGGDGPQFHCLPPRYTQVE